MGAQWVIYFGALEQSWQMSPIPLPFSLALLKFSFLELLLVLEWKGQIQEFKRKGRKNVIFKVNCTIWYIFFFCLRAHTKSDALSLQNRGTPPASPINPPQEMALLSSYWFTYLFSLLFPFFLFPFLFLFFFFSLLPFPFYFLGSPLVIPGDPEAPLPQDTPLNALVLQFWCLSNTLEPSDLRPWHIKISIYAIFCHNSLAKVKSALTIYIHSIFNVIFLFLPTAPHLSNEECWQIIRLANQSCNKLFPSFLTQLKQAGWVTGHTLLGPDEWRATWSPGDELDDKKIF